MLRSHRARLTLASSGSAGILLLVLFAASAIGLRNAETESARGELAPAISLVVGDIRSGHRAFDLAEVVAANPQVSLAAYDTRGSLIARDGKLALPFTKTTGLSMLGPNPIMLQSESIGDVTVVAGLDWTPHDALIRRFVLLCSILWLPMVGVVALATWITARATFLPLERLAGEAEALSAENLAGRLRVQEVGEYRDFVLRLNRFLDRLEASVKREERFLSDAAHELRTPLTSLRGQIEMTLKKPRSEAEYRSTLAVLSEETSRLTSLVELLLRAAVPVDRDAGSIDLADAAERAHARWVDRFAAKGVGLSFDAQPARAAVSDSEFDVIADNLLSNCLRACEAGASCRISTSHSPSGAMLQVIDEGPGLDPEDAERIFERFARLDPGRSRSDGGFGIGLALCKGVVEARGGRIWVEPNEPRGSIFNVQFKSEV